MISTKPSPSRAKVRWNLGQKVAFRTLLPFGILERVHHTVDDINPALPIVRNIP